MSSNFTSSFPLTDDHGAMPDIAGAGARPQVAGSDSNPAQDAQDLMGRVVHGAHETIDRLADTAAPHVQRLQEGMSSASEAMESRAGQLRETGAEWAESLRTTVRENPLAALASAVAVGLVVARLTRR
jgi:ElaB/YqjD/DUF883 family membrane-anchored ribosome-binding protein